MIPRGLLIATSVGVLAGFLFGLIFVEYKVDNKLEFVEGPSISILTNKTDFNKGENISIKIINSGTVPLTFPDTSYGLKITQLDGIVTYRPNAAQVISVLEPKQEATFVWDQIKNNEEPALEGVYKISSEGIDKKEKKIKKSITINIQK